MRVREVIARAAVTTTASACWCCGEPGRVTVTGVLVRHWECADCLGIGTVTWVAP